MFQDNNIHILRGTIQHHPEGITDLQADTQGNTLNSEFKVVNLKKNIVDSKNKVRDGPKHFFPVSDFILGFCRPLFPTLWPL